jgi:dipeptidyl-peptidase-4
VRQAVAGIDEQHDWMYFTAMEASPLERQLYRVHLDGSGMMRLTTAAGVHRISMSPNAKSYVDVFSDAQTLPSLTLSNIDPAASAEKTRDVVLAPARAEVLARFDIQYPEMATIPARDGFPMPASVLKPSGFRVDRRYPVIMAIYGGASSATVTNAWQGNFLYYQLLLAEGYVIVKVDNRSATAISKRLENTALGTIGRSDSDDLIDAARWLKRQPWIDSSRVGVWGWSNGGYMTLSLLTRSSEFKAGIAVAPVTDWRFYDSKWSEAFLGLPSDNPVGYDSASVVTRAAQLHGHLLLVHGSYDDNVHPQNEQAFMNALIKAGKPFELMVYPMRKHDIGDRDANNHLYRTMIDFWKRSL